MIEFAVNPGYALLAGALAALTAPQAWRGAIALAASLGALALAFTPSFGQHAAFAQIGLDVVPLRLDALSQTFGVLFALVSIMLALHGAAPRVRAETGALLVLAGGALSAVYAGDFLSFVAAAELSTLAAVALLLLREEWAAQEMGMRLLGWQALSSILFLSGAAFSIGMTGEAVFERLSPATPGGALILAALGVKAGFPIAHVWLKEALPRATAAGGAAIAAYTTMLGVYGLARGYAGEPMLVVVGLAMAILPAVYAMAEDDLRRALAYGLVAQTGVMVAAIGIGSPLAMAAAAAHAFATTLAFVLLAMALGAVQARTGTARACELGGLARAMPATAALACVAALSIAGAPGTAGFASLALVLDATAQAHRSWAYYALIAAVGASVAHTAVKIPYAAFFAPARKPPPPPALFGAPQLAMVYAAALIVVVGIAPQWLYAFLPPDAVRFSPYDWGRLMSHLQFGAFAALAVAAARMARLYPVETPGELRDVDRIIHGPLWTLAQRAGAALAGAHRLWRRGEQRGAETIVRLAGRWTALADRPARRLAADAAWILIALSGLLALSIAIAHLR
ncbi:MAG: proton-conducting transporter membrane subunit [Hyphomonadaceae bacterium]|nr:proton-conducting transporter membrane subunit [Hyphomonadaceae bacterium]